MNTSTIAAPIETMRLDRYQQDRDIRHELSDMLSLALCAVLDGAQSWADVERYGLERAQWLQSFLALPHGIPDRAAFERLFERIDPVACDALVAPWVQSRMRDLGYADLDPGRIVPRPAGRIAMLAAIDAVSVWAGDTRLMFGQPASASRSNEERAIPTILTMLDLDDAVITIDVRHGQSATTKAIHWLGEHYVVSLPRGADRAQAAAGAFLAEARARSWNGIAHQYLAAVEPRVNGPTRVHYRITSAPNLIAAIDPTVQNYPGLASVCFVERERADRARSEPDVDVFISSLSGDTATLIQSIRRTRQLPAPTQWVLDIASRPEAWPRPGHAEENLAVLQRVAFELTRSGHPGDRALDDRLVQVIAASAAERPAIVPPPVLAGGPPEVALASL